MRAALAAIVVALACGGCVLPPRPRAVEEKLVRHEAQRQVGIGRKVNPAWWLGNIDDPTPPGWYWPNNKFRNISWQLRNPFHNFTFYVIGVADHDFVRYGREPDGVFAASGGWNWAVIEDGWLHLPFVSYQGKGIKFYALWRERGNFGLKLTNSKQNGCRAVRPERAAWVAAALHPTGFHGACIWR